MKWGNICQEPQVPLTHLIPRNRALLPADSIPEPCILAPVPLPGVHLLDSCHKTAALVTTFFIGGYIFKALLGYRKDRSVFPHLGRTWWRGAIQGPSPPVPVHVGRPARMGPQRLCQLLPSLPSFPCHHHTHRSSSSPVTPGLGPISTHLGHCFLLRLLPQTYLLLFMRPQLSPLRSPTCHQPWPVPASMVPPPPEHSSPSSIKGDRKGPCHQVLGEKQ